MKIQINSLEALERLIGGDTKLEIEIRNSIVQEFTKKYLKSIVNTEIVKAAHSSIIKELQTTIFEQVKVGWNNTYVLTEPYKQIIKNQAEELVQKAIIESADSVANYDEIRVTVYKRLQDQIKWIDDGLSKETIETKMTNLFEKIIREKLKL